MTSHDMFRLPIRARVDVSGYPILPSTKVQAGYDTRDPFAVTLDLNTFDQPQRLTFARDLLAEGQRRPAGTPGGDIAIRPARERVLVIAVSPTGPTAVWLLGAFVSYFLDLTYQRVPAGAEAQCIDWDRLLGEPT
jgi:sporulation and cell division protein SsgA